MSTEKPTNETASELKEQIVESGQTSEEKPTEDVLSNSSVEEPVQPPTDKPEESTPEWDAKTSYDALQKNYDQVNQSYTELRREFTRRTQNEADLQRKLDNLTDTINKATEKPIDPKQFFNDLQTQGPKAFDQVFAKREEALKADFEKQRTADQEAITQMQFETGKLARRADSINYPDFQKLEKDMANLVADEKISLNMDEGAGAVLDTLYKLAKNMNANKAIKEAKEIGRKEADAQTAKEADARVAGGGKAGPVTDYDKIPLGELRARIIAERGIAEDNGQ
jgi:hypothetical protein